MVDRLTRAQRSRNMARIRGAHTVPERTLRSALHRMGLRFRLHQADLPGRPDIVLRRFRTAIFVHGCFWHRHRGCSYAATPKTRAKFWQKKLNGNRGRDSRQIRSLVEMGWRVLVVWECALRNEGGQAVAASVTEWIRGESPFSEIASTATRYRTEGRRKPP
jgi:DNA mismatch endonuclease (patch repair protein)